MCSVQAIGPSPTLFYSIILCRSTLPSLPTSHCNVLLDAQCLLSRFRFPDRQGKDHGGRHSSSRGLGGFRLPTEQVNAPPDAPIRAFLTRNILPGEEEPAVLRLADCVELRTIVHRDTVEVYVDDFQHTQLDLSELILRVGYFSPL